MKAKDISEVWMLFTNTTWKILKIKVNFTVIYLMCMVLFNKAQVCLSNFIHFECVTRCYLIVPPLAL